MAVSQIAERAPMEADAARSRPLRSLQRGVFRAFSWWIGTVLSQSLLGALMVVGWTQRVVRLAVLRRWPGADPGGSDRTSRRVGWITPEAGWSAHWDSTQGGSWFRRALALVGASANAVWSHLALGFSSLLASWLLIGPSQILWAFSWHAGWNTSFAKIYEQSSVGLLTGLLGIGLFVTAASLLPIAQARHAVTRDWRTALDVPLLWRLATARPLATLGTALCYSAASLPLTVLVIAPVFFGQELVGPVLELRQTLARYWLVVTAIGFPLFVLLRLLSGRLYAAALQAAAGQGRLDRKALHPEELRLLGLLPLRSASSRLVRRLVLVPALALTIFVWFTFVAQIYVAAFFHDRGPRQWLNQPLLEMPWWRTLPAHLKQVPSDESEDPRASQ